jgi:hypothetical protein
VDELAAEVAGASREQTQGIVQINTAVGQMDKVTQSNASCAEESAAAAQELNAQAEIMKQSVAELLRLVGNHSLANPAKPPISSSNSKLIRRVAPAGRQTTATIGNGHPSGAFPATWRTEKALADSFDNFETQE